MKKTMPIVATILILFGCDWKNQPETNKASSSPTPSVLSSTKPTIAPTKLPEPTVTPSFDGTGLDVYGKGIFCEKRYNMKAKLDKPVNIAVKRDGSQVYVVNGKCGRKPYIKSFGGYLDQSFCRDFNTTKDDTYMDIVENNPILTIKDNGKINILYGDNSDFFYCSNDGEIATDELDYLYFSANRKVYKVNNDKETQKVVDLDELEKTNTKSVNKNGMIRGINIQGYTIFLDVEDWGISERYKEPDPSTLRPYFGFPPVYTDFAGVIKKVYGNNITDIIEAYTTNLRTPFEIRNDKLLLLAPILYYDSEKVFGIYESGISEVTISALVEHNHNTKGFVDLKNLLYKGKISSIKVNSKGEVFIIVGNYNQIYKINLNKKIELFAGSDKFDDSKNTFIEGFKDGKGTEALFSYPTGLAIDGQDNLYVADTGNNAIRKITPDGVVSTFYVEKGGN